MKLNVSAHQAKSLSIKTEIADSGHPVGLNIYGSHPGYSLVYLQGSTSNTFTGEALVSGAGNILVLEKTNGAIAVRGDITVSDGASLVMKGVNQTLASSVLRVRNAYFEFGNVDMELSNKFRQMIVEGTVGLSFMHTTQDAAPFQSRRFLYLDDLIISDGSFLSITEWEEGRDYLLVRKDSANLQDALKKMNFVGYDRNAIHLEDYDADYYSISSTPEPATCGALIGALGLGLVAYRRKTKCRSPELRDIVG